MTVRQAVRRVLQRLGYDVLRYRPDSSVEAQIGRLLTTLAPDLVVDVGANAGQYVELLRRCGFSGRVVSFEPLTEPHADLVRKAERDALWEVAPRIAIGEMEAELEINVSANSISSSLLPMLPAHLAAAPESAYLRTERVAVARLDRALVPYLRDTGRILLKIDTQGYEARVLDGATGLAGRIAAIQLELSLTPLYAGEVLFLEMANRLDRHGFDLFALIQGQVDPSSGRTLQVDAFFVRKTLASPPEAGARASTPMRD